MTYLTRIQKHIIGFKPDTHWKMILFTAFFLLFAGIAYDVYVYMYGMQQIRTIGSSVPNKVQATSTVDLNMDELFEMYENRKVLYTGIIQTLYANKGTSPVQATTSTTTGKTNTVATSSKQ